MERLPPLTRLHITAAALGLFGAFDPGAIGFGSKGPRPKPIKICRNKGCRKEHRTGLPCCSAECHAAWKRGDDTPVIENNGFIEIIIPNGVTDAATEPPPTPPQQ